MQSAVALTWQRQPGRHRRPIRRQGRERRRSRPGSRHVRRHAHTLPSDLPLERGDGGSSLRRGFLSKPNLGQRSRPCRPFRYRSSPHEARRAMNTVHRITGYDKQSEFIVQEFDIPSDRISEVRELANVDPHVGDIVGAHPLDRSAAQTVEDRFHFGMWVDRCDWSSSRSQSEARPSCHAAPAHTRPSFRSIGATLSVSVVRGKTRPPHAPRCRPRGRAAAGGRQAAFSFGWISPRLTSTSAICTALSAAPLRRLSDTHQSTRPLSTVGSSRMREM